jgi:hypothetical protein
MPKYRGLNGALPGGAPDFWVVIDGDTLTWVSDPPGHTINEPIILYFPLEGAAGAIGSGKQFQVLPEGRVRLLE